MPRNDLIQLRRDTAANWTSTNPTLASGEMGFETDTGKFKIGTGSTAWVSLLYVTDASPNVTDASPRGVMAFTSRTTPDTTITSEEVQITGSSFTAVANRYYKITYFEPALYHGSQATATARIRLTNIAGAVQQSSLSFAYMTSEETTCVAITTLTAGTTNFVATLQSSSGNIQATRSATQYAFLLVEDIGADNNNNN
jgi:hypothetical protein